MLRAYATLLFLAIHAVALPVLFVRGVVRAFLRMKGARGLSR